ncbi:MAG: PEP-CTERM sorting domain-containing protein [Deltaproteobacteria bacterium]|nr:PEP-CTERM sorting domain-containing protein [Deltaproteobacteria bacterium]
MRYVSLTVFLLCFVSSAGAETISLWNFNDAISGESGGLQEFLVDYGNGMMDSNFEEADIGNSSGSSVNTIFGDPAGLSLVLKDQANNGKNLTWMVDTTGFFNIGVRFATRRTSTGFNTNQFFYSIDSGLSWLDYGSPYVPGIDFGLQSFDLGSIDALSNNSDAGFRIVFDGATSYSGNNRIDNLVVSGTPASFIEPTPVPEPATAMLVGFGLLGILVIRRKTA